MQKKNIIVSTALLLGLCGCTQEPINNIVIYEGPSYTSINRELDSKKNPFEITVESGDSLYKIAKKYDVSLRPLIERNRLYPPYRLQPGQSLKLPKARFHILKEKDTLHSIAEAYDINLHQLANENNLSHPYRLQVGHKLKLPHHGGSYVDETQREIAQQDDDTPSITPSPRRNVESRPITTTKTSVSTASSSQSSQFSWPTKGKVISEFGPKKGGLYNDGINIAAPDGSAITAAESGKVVYAGNELRGYGNLILIKHDNGYLTAYAHARRLLVKNGAIVKKGQTIAEVGKTGHVDQPQLHFSIRKGRKALNPKKYLS